MTVAIDCLLWLPLCLLLVGLIEYVGHRWLLHHAGTTVGRDHIEHHRIFAREFEWVPETPAFYDAPLVRAAMGAAWSVPLMVPVWLYLSESFAATFAACVVIHWHAWMSVHNQMHRPSWRWLTSTRWFRYVRDRHRTHHLKPRSNFAFLFAPVWDVIFRTTRGRSP